MVSATHGEKWAMAHPKKLYDNLASGLYHLECVLNLSKCLSFLFIFLPCTTFIFGWVLEKDSEVYKPL